jgi:hypothetical protein
MSWLVEKSLVIRISVNKERPSVLRTPSVYYTSAYLMSMHRTLKPAFV